MQLSECLHTRSVFSYNDALTGVAALSYLVNN